MSLMRSFKRFVKSSTVGRVALLPARLKLGLSYTAPEVFRVFQWLRSSREHTNLTYDLDALNREHLAFFVAACLNIDIAEVRGYFAEILDDRELSDHIRRMVRAGPARAISDEVARYGRRIAWYALVRATKPRVVVETGVDKGLGSCVIASALRQNASEGQPGMCVCLDINPEAGYLVAGTYADFARLEYGDSITTLQGMTEQIDLFINDSDHSDEYEAREYETVSSKLSPRAIVIGDNAHVSARLAQFAERTGRRFLFFQERPDGHWYRGGGLGIAFSRDARAIKAGIQE